MITRSYRQTDENTLRHDSGSRRHGVLNPQTALATPDGEIDFVFLCKRNSNRKPARQQAAPLQLKERGVERALHLRELGFDAST